MSNRKAILIGNQNFSDQSKLPNLLGPINDVFEMSRILSDPSKGDFEVTQLVDETSYNIRLCLDEALSGARSGDIILIYYSGHGKIDKSGSLCLTASDTKAAVLQSTTLPAKQLCYMIGQSDCETVILLLDCCYSGIAVNIHRGDIESQLRTLESTGGLFILAASSDIQTASEMEHPVTGKKMGRFTYSIVEAIDSGAADENLDGQISISELVKYLKSHVKTQSPQWFAANASGDPRVSFNPLASEPTSLDEMKKNLYSDDPAKRTSAYLNLARTQVTHANLKDEIRTIIEDYEISRDQASVRMPDYDSSKTYPAFAGWTAFSFGLPPNSPVIMRPTTDNGVAIYDLKSSGVGRIGVQKTFDFFKGRFLFKYRLIESHGDNVQFHVVPKQFMGDIESYPWQTDKHMASVNNFFEVKGARVIFDNLENDNAWHEAEISFDFSSISKYIVVAFGPRINECSGLRGAGHILFSDVGLYGIEATPSRHAR